MEANAKKQSGNCQNLLCYYRRMCKPDHFFDNIRRLAALRHISYVERGRRLLIDLSQWYVKVEFPICEAYHSHFSF